MKKMVSILLIVFFSIGLTFAQNNDDDIKSLQKKIDKSEIDIKNPKKNIKYQTWAKRGEIFLEAFSVSTKYLAVGIEAISIPFVTRSIDDPTRFYGDPSSKTFEGDYEVWKYDKIKIYINSDGYIEKWEETKIPFPSALEKSYEAYIKAIELDTKKSFVNKKTTMQQLSNLRDNLLNAAIKAHQEDDNAAALNYIEKSIELYQYPKLDSDTLIPFGIYTYFAGIFSYNSIKSVTDTNLTEQQIQENITYNAPLLEKSIEYFQTSIDEQYEIGISHQYITELMYQQDDTINAIEFLELGANKYPQEPKIIYTLIDYYTPRGEYDKAFKYIDAAISMTPEMSILYIVKGDSYARIFYDFQNKYFDLLSKADSLNKLAVRNRANPTVQKEIKDAEMSIINNDIPPIEKQMNDYSEKTIENYKLAISKDIDNYDHYYKISNFYYKRSKLNTQKASGLSKLKDVILKLNTDAKTYMNLAKDFGETSLEKNETDFYTLDLLRRIYFGLQMYDESNEMKRRIGEL